MLARTRRRDRSQINSFLCPSDGIAKNTSIADDNGRLNSYMGSMGTTAQNGYTASTTGMFATGRAYGLQRRDGRIVEYDRVWRETGRDSGQ